MYGLGDLAAPPAVAVSGGPPCSWYQSRGSDAQCHLDVTLAGKTALVAPLYLLYAVGGESVAPVLSLMQALPGDRDQQQFTAGAILWGVVGLAAYSLLSKRRGR